MKNPDPLEKDIERRVCNYAKELKMLVYKFTSPSRRSVPDRMFIAQGGLVFFIEFKRKGEKPTPSQEVEIAKIRAAGVQVFVVDNISDGRNIIDTIARRYLAIAIRSVGQEISSQLEEMRLRRELDNY